MSHGKHVALLALFLLLGCENEFRTRFEPDCQEAAERERFAKLIVDCTAAGNPKSDEEGEDLVAQCESTARRAVCPRRTVRYECGRGNCWRIK